jgi:hypothetical protein
MPTLMKCPCGQHLQVQDQDLGKQARCPRCKVRLLIPRPRGTASTSPASRPAHQANDRPTASATALPEQVRSGTAPTSPSLKRQPLDYVSAALCVGLVFLVFALGVRTSSKSDHSAGPSQPAPEWVFANPWHTRSASSPDVPETNRPSEVPVARTDKESDQPAPQERPAPQPLVPENRSYQDNPPVSEPYWIPPQRADDPQPAATPPKAARKPWLTEERKQALIEIGIGVAFSLAQEYFAPGSGGAGVMPGKVHVNAYQRADGTPVREHYRSAPGSQR